MNLQQEVVGGAVPKNFFPAVEKGIQESVGRGPLAAYPVVGVKAVSVRWLLPSGRLFGDGIQDRSDSGIQEGLLWKRVRFC